MKRLLCSCGVEGILVSLGDVVEVEAEEDGDSGKANNWWDDNGLGSADNLVAFFLANSFAFVWENASNEEDGREEVEGSHYEELNSHPLDEGLGGLCSVFLEPHEPLPWDPEWQESENEVHDSISWRITYLNNTSDNGVDSLDDLEDSHDLHTTLDWYAEAAGLSFFLVGGVRHLSKNI